MIKYEDPGHGWLQVDLTEYPDAIDCGSGFGYRDGAFIYLEEDMEMGAFLRLHPEIDRSRIRVLYSDRDSIIRSLPSNEARLDYETYRAIVQGSNP